MFGKKKPKEPPPAVKLRLPKTGWRPILVVGETYYLSREGMEKPIKMKVDSVDSDGAYLLLPE